MDAVSTSASASNNSTTASTSLETCVQDMPSLDWNTQIHSPIFGFLLIITLIGAILLLVNAWVNLQVVDIEVKYSHGITIWAFLAISIVLAILLAHMVYRPYLVDTANGKYNIITALFLYVLAQIFWSTTLFHSRINRGVAGIASIIWFASTVWLGWLCYHFFKDTIFIFMLLLIWNFYIQIYTLNVDAHPWIIIGNTS